MTLAYDYARCNGTEEDLCRTCRRREPGHAFYQAYMAPPIKRGNCEMYIMPRKRTEHQEGKKDD